MVKPMTEPLLPSAKLGARKPFEKVPRTASCWIGVNLAPILGEKLL